MQTILRMTGRQHAQLRTHLFPGDGNEAVALALCGRRAGEARHVLTVRKIIFLPYEDCAIRTPWRVTWSTAALVPLLDEAARRDMAILKIHSHPGGLAEFSDTDDESDRDLFPSVYGWTDGEHPHSSAIMLPDGHVFGRVIEDDGGFIPLSLVTVVGDDLRYFFHSASEVPAAVSEFARRHAQAFGAGTFNLLKQLSIAVIGCSGTGSPVIEQLARLGVGRLVIVDPDRVEVKNLNRILNTGMNEARGKRFKVNVLAQAIRRIGIGTKVVPLARDLHSPEVVKEVAECDAVFGCMDTVDGRHLLNRLAVFYTLPYLDVGVKLVADGAGGVEQICGTVHYLQPDGSSLLSRGVYSIEQVRAAALKRTNPAAYREQLQSKYIVGVQEDRPAVISVNMQLAGMAVNEFLARVHNYRDDGNAPFAVNRISLTQAQSYHEADGAPCPVLSRHVGRGDVAPLLETPELSEVEPGEAEMVA